MDYYSVKAKFGHVGKNKYIVKTIPTSANSGKEAAFSVRWMGRVKHNSKDAILEVKKISREECLALEEANRKDPYLLAHSRQEQKILCGDLSDQIINCLSFNKEKRNDRIEKVEFKMRKNKINNSDALYSMRNYEISLA